MHVDETALAALVRRNIPPENAKDCRVYYETQIKHATAPVRVGLRQVPMPFEGLQVFVDLMPDANWGHRVIYLLVSPDFSQVARYEEQFPPFGADLPDNWRAMALDEKAGS